MGKKDLYLLTGNPGKFVEFQRLIPTVQQLQIELVEIQSLDPKEVIKYKLEGARKHHKQGILIVEDTSLELECLKGLPGPFIKWFEKILGLDAIAQMAEKLSNTHAIARTSIGLLDAKGQTQFFEGTVEGDFVYPRGEQDFGWGPAFQLKGTNRTFGEMTRKEKDQYGMRAQAIKKLMNYLKKG